MSETIKGLIVKCVHCGHTFFTDEVMHSHVHCFCVKCGSKWSQENNANKTIKVITQ